MSKGLLITLEGCDGLGKSVQSAMLVRALSGLGHKVYFTKEPGNETLGSPIGITTRDVLFRHLYAVSPGSEQLYLLLDHIDNVGRLTPHLESGDTVVCDRWVDSAFAYASVHDVPTSPEVLTLWDLHRGPEPDVTVLFVAAVTLPDQDVSLNGDVSWALGRARTRAGAESTKQSGKVWNNFESLQRVQDTYLEMLSGLPRTLIVPVVESDSADTVHQRVLDGIITKLGSLECCGLLG